MKRRILSILTMLILIASTAWASSETTNLGLTKPTKGDRNWGQTVNNNMDLIDSAVGTIQSKSDDLPEVYIYTGTFNSTTGYQISLPKSVDNVNEYAVKVTPTTRAGAIGDIYVTKTTSNFTVKCSEANTTDTFSAAVYYIGDVSAYGSSIYRKWYVSPDAGITDHANASTTGSLAWIQAQISTDQATVELPGNKTYQIKQDLTLNDNLYISRQKGGIIDTDISIRDSNYQWNLSGSGTNEYYLQASGGGNPNINQPAVVIENNSRMTEGNAGSLAAGEWDWADNDSLGYAVPYVRLSDSADPDGKSADYVEAGYQLTINATFDMTPHQAFSGEGHVGFGSGAVEKSIPQWWYLGSGSYLTAINNAIQSIAGGDVWIGGGASKIYSIDGPIIPKTGVNLKSDGAKIYLANSTNDDMVDFSSATTDVIIEGFEFDGNGSNQSRSGDVNIIHATAQVKRIIITKCKLSESCFNSIRLDTALAHEDIIITENKFYDYDATAIQIYGTAGGIISNNIFDNTGLASLTAGANAISISEGTDFTIPDNTIEMDSTALAPSFGIETGNGSHNCTITGNSVQCNSGTFNGGISVGEGGGAGSNNTVISGNSVYQAGKVAAIEVSGALDGASIIGNTIGGTANGVASIAINSNNANIVVVGNTIFNYSGVGINVVESAGTYSNIYSIVISGNSLIDSTAGAASSKHSIYLNYAPYRGAVISNNVIHNNINCRAIQLVTTSDTSKAMEGFSITGNSIYNCQRALSMSGSDNSDHIITGNVFRGCTQEAALVGTGHVIKNNTPDTEILTGTITLNRYMSAAEIDSSGGSVAATLGSGYFIGQIKTVTMINATTSSTLRVLLHDDVAGIPAYDGGVPSGDSEYGTFDAVNETWILMWTGTEWTTLRATCTF